MSNKLGNENFGEPIPRDLLEPGQLVHARLEVIGPDAGDDPTVIMECTGTLESDPEQPPVFTLQPIGGERQPPRLLVDSDHLFFAGKVVAGHVFFYEPSDDAYRIAAPGNLNLF